MRHQYQIYENVFTDENSMSTYNKRIRHPLNAKQVMGREMTQTFSMSH